MAQQDNPYLAPKEKMITAYSKLELVIGLVVGISSAWVSMVVCTIVWLYASASLDQLGLTAVSDSPLALIVIPLLLLFGSLRAYQLSKKLSRFRMVAKHGSIGTAVGCGFFLFFSVIGGWAVLLG